MEKSSYFDLRCWNSNLHLGSHYSWNQGLNDDDDAKCSVFSFDLTKPGLGWKTIDPPLYRDDFHSECGVEFKGKIYLVRDSEHRCRCEVFDPQLNQWNRFKTPPYYSKRKRCTIYVEPPVMADLKNDRIIVWFKYPSGPCNASLLCAYYPNEDRWVVVAEDFRGWYRIHLHPLVAFVEGVIYVFNPISVTLRGFDLSKKEWFNVVIAPGHENYLPRNFRYDSLLHRGNGLLYVFGSTRKFGIIDGASSDDIIETIVRAVEFKVEIKDEKPHLTWLSSRIFQTNESCNIFHYVLV